MRLLAAIAVAGGALEDMPLIPLYSGQGASLHSAKIEPRRSPLRAARWLRSSS